MASEFPITLVHPKTKGTTRAATRGSLKVLEARGWKRQTDKTKNATRTSTKPDPTGDGS